MQICSTPFGLVSEALCLLMNYVVDTNIIKMPAKSGLRKIEVLFVRGFPRTLNQEMLSPEVVVAGKCVGPGLDQVNVAASELFILPG